MSTLRLVVDNTQDEAFLSLISALEGVVESPSIEISAVGPGREGLLEARISNTENGASMRIVFDPAGMNAMRRGIHATIDGVENCEYNLAQKLERGFEDGFDTIWIHS